MFAYGPTGTGKTHTMGTLGVEVEQEQGVLPRAVKQVGATSPILLLCPMSIIGRFLLVF